MNFDYKQEQLTNALRHQNSIHPHKILNIDGNNLVVRLWQNSEQTATVPVSMADYYNIGDYVDMQVFQRGKTGYSITLIGNTPEKFIPCDGADIGA